MDYKLIDTHCHLLFGVDDGPQKIEESVQMLVKAAEEGIGDIILTPHYRHGMFPYIKEDILRNFRALQESAAKEEINLYLGCEYHVDSRCTERFKSGRCLTLAGSSYILTEYSHITEYSYILTMTQNLLLTGYTPVIAHTERYPCMLKSVAHAKELRRMGAMIQINADSVLGLEGRNQKLYCKDLLKEGAADIIASDSHGIEDRVCHLRECRDLVEKKYGNEAALLLFKENPEKILKDASMA